MIAETKPPGWVEGSVPVGSTHSYYFATTKKTGVAPSAERVKRGQSVGPKLHRNTRQRETESQGLTEMGSR